EGRLVVHVDGGEHAVADPLGDGVVAVLGALDAQAGVARDDEGRLPAGVGALHRGGRVGDRREQAGPRLHVLRKSAALGLAEAIAGATGACGAAGRRAAARRGGAARGRRAAGAAAAGATLGAGAEGDEAKSQDETRESHWGESSLVEV